MKPNQPPRLSSEMREIWRMQQRLQQSGAYQWLEEQETIRRAVAPYQENFLSQSSFLRQVEMLSKSMAGIQDMVARALVALQGNEVFNTNILDCFPDPADFVLREANVEDGIEALDASGYGFVVHTLEDAFVAEFGTISSGIQGAVTTNRLTALTRDRQFLDQFREYVEGTPVFKRRWPIIDAAVQAHCRKNYLLAIPALLSQLEGCVTDMLVLRGEAIRYRGKLYARGQDGKVKKGRDNKPVKLVGLDSKLSNSQWNNDDVLRSIASLITNTLAGERNGILHGRNVRYGRPKLSTQCILLIWILSREVGFCFQPEEPD